MWEWTEALTNWTPDKLKLLEVSWSDSTKKSYKAAWQRWCSWSKKNNVNHFSPSGSDLARFLSDLYNNSDFAYNTSL